MVLDTDVVVASFRSPRGASAELLRLLDRGMWKMPLSVALALEYEAVCLLPEHREVAGVTLAEARIFVDTVIGLAEPAKVHFRWRPLLRDACDEMVLEAAINGGAEVLVTFNRKDYGSAPAGFGIDLLLPSEALKRIRL